MKDVEKILQKAGNQEIKIPLSVKEKIQYAINNVENKQNKIGAKQLLQFIVGMIITMISTTGICWATVQIYNEYIKKQETIQSTSLFHTGDGISSYETDLTQNDMVLDEENGFYYKLICDLEGYTIYKNRINVLPEMKSEDFENKFILIITWQNEREIHETDLEVIDIQSDDTTTNIILKQKENPDYNSKDNIIYAVISNEKLKNNIKIQVENHKILATGYTDISELPSDYSIEKAISDGCFVIENNVIKSENPYAIDKFIEKAEKRENCFIRIYCKEQRATYVYDIEYKDGIFYESKKNISNLEEKESFHSYEKLLRVDDALGAGYFGILRKEDLEENSDNIHPILFINSN